MGTVITEAVRNQPCYNSPDTYCVSDFCKKHLHRSHGLGGTHILNSDLFKGQHKLVLFYSLLLDHRHAVRIVVWRVGCT